MKNIFRKAVSFSVIGSMGIFVASSLVGCSSNEHNNTSNNTNVFDEAAQKKGAFVVIKEVTPGHYKIVDEYPSSETRVILEDINGTQRILSKEELDELIKEADKKIEANQSPLTNPQISEGGGGLSLGETLLASAAGAILGSWIGSKLFNNPTYQQQRAKSYSNPSVLQRSKDAFRNKSTSSMMKKSTTSSPVTKPSNTKKGFFSSSSTKTSTSSFRSFGG